MQLKDQNLISTDKKKKITHKPIQVKTINRIEAIVDLDELDTQDKCESQKTNEEINDIQNTIQSQTDATIDCQQEQGLQPDAKKKLRSVSPSINTNQTSPVIQVKQQQQNQLLKFVKPISNQQKKNQLFYYQFKEEDDIFKIPPKPCKKYQSFKDLMKDKTQQKQIFSKNQMQMENEYKDQLINTLIECGVNYEQADQSRRMLIAHFETIQTLSYKVPAITDDGFEVKAGDGYFQEIANEERRKRIDRGLTKYKQFLNEVKDNTNISSFDEQHGFNAGVTSIYIPSRVFFGYLPEPELNASNIYIQPLSIEDQINYEEETCGFDEKSEQDETDESSASDEPSSSKQNEADILDQLFQPKEKDDIHEEDEIDCETGMLKTSGVKKQKIILEALAKKQREFVYPVPVLCPDSIKGIKQVFTVFDVNKDRILKKQQPCNKDFEVVTLQINKFDNFRDGIEQETEGVKYYCEASIPKHLQPVIVSIKGLDCCFNECEFVVKEENEEELK